MKPFALFLFLVFSVSLTSAQFAPPVAITNDGSPKDIGSGDFNQDGFIDIAYSSDINDPSIHIVLNDGTGNFLTPAFEISDIGQGHAFGIGDLDGDGILDLAAVGNTSTSINWFSGNGDGTFSAANVINSAIGSSFISDIAIVDLDKNGHNDILLVSRDNVPDVGFVAWYSNNGNGDIEPGSKIYENLDFSFNLAIGDLDGDIYPDIVVGKKEPNALFWFDYNPGGTFSYEALNTTMEFAARVLIADVDSDGNQDIIAAESGASEIYYWRKMPNGNHGPQAELADIDHIVGGLGYEDMNLDGKPDLVISELNGEVEYYPRNGNNGFDDPIFLADSLSFSHYLVLLDSDNDNDMDIVTTSQFLSNTTSVNQVTYFRNLFNDPSMTGNVFWDENTNAVLDMDEDFLSNFPIEVSPEAIAVFTNDDGSFRVFGEPGDYELTPDYGVCWGPSTSPGTYTINFDGVNTIDSLLFGVEIVSNAENVHLGMTSAPTRCGFTVPFWLNYTNTGCQSVSGKIQLIQSDLAGLLTVDPLPDNSNNDTLTWDFEELIPGQNRQVKLFFQIADASFLGDTIYMPLRFFKENMNGSFEVIDSFSYTSVINCSYDPNDKQTYPRRSEIPAYDENYTLMDERLDYTIRFQNTGTDTAFNIVIRDTLSDLLDFNTFQPLSASHDYETILHADGLVEFYFRGILLVDSFTNEAASHGYVQFSIQAKNNLPDETSILNSAGIYFDFNPPILTNSVENLMVEMLPIILDLKTVEATDPIQVYPNPISVGYELNLIDLPSGEKTISVWDNLGQIIFMIKTEDDSFSIYEESWKAGLYWILVETENTRMVEKVIVN